MDVKCAQCGYVNVVADEACRACGFELQPVPFYQDAPSQPEVDYQTEPPRLLSDVIQPFSGAGELISSTLRLFKDNFWMIAKFAFVIVAPFEIFRALSEQRMQQDPQLALGVFTLQLFSNVLIVPALFYGLMKVMETGVTPGINEAYRWGWSKIPKLAVASLIAWLLIGAGSLLCIIPGVFLFLAFHVVYPVAVFENGSVIDVLKRSYNLTEGRRWNILAAALVVGFVAFLAAIPAFTLNLIFVVNEISFWPLQAAAAIFGAIVAEAGTVLTLVVYLSILRALESGQ